MAIVAMKHLRLVGLESEREALLKALQDMGCVEVSGVDGAEDALHEGFYLFRRVGVGGLVALAKLCKRVL